ncbi:hypothetical protein [Engelhardtia mirabilis]|uniref:Cytochrome c domain-containing protein n=1 Tax=Engelhardtia mirabilis TaxID=2528011 RepID=A0A518BN84_9BACT|nr:hypothetical protein Pla133_35140 [Planctomycetes bacterium Pla133]QDV02742.1 hypothetical protein Pla86_35120 [Planctomycetes bacterium Pla86]
MGQLSGEQGAVEATAELEGLAAVERESGLVRVVAVALVLLAFAALALSGCGGGAGGDTAGLTPQSSTSCMLCHNGTLSGDYAGPGIENPHPFPGAANLDCATCHGGNVAGDTKELAHVPPPPQIGDRDFQDVNAQAYFNRLTLVGIDKFPDYTVGGTTYTALDYLQWINPGDLRVTEAGLGCGQCHAPHSDSVAHSLLATSSGIFSGASFASGVENEVPASVDLWQDTAADLGWRAVVDPAFNLGTAQIGEVSELIEYPVFSVRNDPAPDAIHNNAAYNAANLLDDVQADGRLVTGSELANLYHEQVAFTCGDCHLGSAGANNRSGDYRSSGCTACHMPYSLGGRSGSLDPHVNKLEPLDPDDIDDPEWAHVRAHKIVSVKKTLSNGATVEGMDDLTCAGCHQGSNRTVMQYWGIRLDQNENVRKNRQYPANPVSFTTTQNDTRLFDPVLGNKEFNGRDHRQYLAEEDYDGDGRDDTPPDVHHEAGMGCIDCHGSNDLHGGKVGDGRSELRSRQEQAVAIACESCHGTATAYAPTVAGTSYAGQAGQHATDTEGNVLRHVRREGDGHLYLYSRLTGVKHFVPQTLDTIVDNGVVNPLSTVPGSEPVYSASASYAMGRIDGLASTGIGPQQEDWVATGFSHTDRLDCATCHASWTNTCMGCHLEGEYNQGNNFSNITGDRIVFREKFADFVYQSPLMFQLGVDHNGEIAQMSANTKTFFRYNDLNGARSEVFAFSDRNVAGNAPSANFPALSHNAMMAHSIRGRVDSENEGPRYCVACHLTDDAITDFGSEYASFRTAIQTGDYDSLNWTLLQDHIGRNPGNQLNSPMFVHMVAGLGSGMFLFDAGGAPVNPLDIDPQRKPLNVAPSTVYDPADIVYDLDRIVSETGTSFASNNHPLLTPGVADLLRDGASDLNMAGPLGTTLTELLANPSTGLVLDSWYNADGQPEGNASTFVGP